MATIKIGELQQSESFITELTAEEAAAYSGGGFLSNIWHGIKDRIKNGIKDGIEGGFQNLLRRFF